MLTPLVKHYSVRFGFVDIPKDNRRMHHKPIPTIGGLAIYAAFVLVALVMNGFSRELMGILVGGTIIVLLGIPLFDITFACLRRIWNHVSPMHPDRSHIHHRLIDVGFNQRQSVAILYVAASLLGVCAVMVSTSGPGKALMVLAAVIAIGIISLRILSQRIDPSSHSHDDQNTAAKK